MVSTRKIYSHFMKIVVFILMQIWSNQIIRGGVGSQDPSWQKKIKEIDRFYVQLNDWSDEE